MPESVKNASDEDLLEGFLDMNADQAVRDTSQALLEARKYLRHGDALRMDVQGLLLAVMSDENQLGVMTKAGIRGMLARHSDLLPENR